MDELNYITRSKYSCDSCGAEGPTALYHHRGTPVLSQCGTCDPKGWEKAKDAPLEEWTAEDDGVTQYETQAMLEAGYDPEKPVHNGRFWA